MKYIEKDITTVTTGVLAHGCNCSGGFGGGVAGAMKNKFPSTVQAHKDMGTGKQLLGTAHIICVNEDNTLFVANCYTQEFYGPGDKKYASVEAIRTSLDCAFSHARMLDLPIYLPQLGCGLAGLDWELDVKPVIHSLDEQYETVETTICMWG